MLEKISSFGLLSRPLATLLVLGTLCPAIGIAGSFGVYDPRTQALGGTAVAVGDLAVGYHYNPSLLAWHNTDEDLSRAGRHSLGMVLGPVSEGAEIAADAISDNLETKLNEAINRFNAAPSRETAVAGVAAARELRQAMQDLDGEPIHGEAYAGYGVSEPGDRQGGAVFLHGRVVGGGVANIAASDLALIDRYIEALNLLETGGDALEAYPDLFGADGRLISPREEILSEAQARGVILVELGVAAARQFKLFGHPVALGIAPKAVQARTFDDQWRVVDGDFDSSGDEEIYHYFNLDLGASLEAGRWRLGLAVKDVIGKNFVSELGREIRLRPRTRLGFAYLTESTSSGLDLDLTPVTQVYGPLDRQDISFGFEYRPIRAMALRAGYRYDMLGEFGGLASAGIGFRAGAMTLDLGVSTGEYERAFGLTLGYRQ